MERRESSRSVLVYAHWSGIDEPLLMGKLNAQHLRGKEIFSFEYDEDWLRSDHAQLLDPDLALYSGIHFPTEDKPNFGIFLDSSPDRWGRLLMRRRELAKSREEGRQVRNLFEIDYLLGVYDGHRMGALRYKQNADGLFLDDNRGMATPPWAELRQLEEISLNLEKDGASDDPDYLNWLNILMAPGSSLGGARPKAGVINPSGHLWIAKFPSSRDECDEGAWEMVAHELAMASGVKMSECTAKRFSHRHHTFLTKRFDRNEKGERLHFASAMTMLGFVDGQEDGSYLHIVDFLTSHGAKVNEDLEQLWRRIVFNICISNTDDHLRNHGFILTPKGWILSPAFDLNPNESGSNFNLNISEHDNALSLELAMEVSGLFRIKAKTADRVIDEVRSAVSNWRRVASNYGISRDEQDLKSPAFRAAG